MAARVIRVVATIEAIDTAAQTVTLKGPKGRYHTVQVQDPAVMKRVKKGDTVVVTAAEALAISLEKAKKVEGK
jgi:Cu/Ag efflux protein CusF